MFDRAGLKKSVSQESSVLPSAMRSPVMSAMVWNSGSAVYADTMRPVTVSCVAGYVRVSPYTTSLTAVASAEGAVRNEPACASPARTL